MVHSTGCFPCCGIKNCSLSPKGYGLSKLEIAIISLTAAIFGGIPFAVRHLTLACKKDQSFCGHVIIACIQFLPGIGTIAALFEYIVVKTCGKNKGKMTIKKPKREAEGYKASSLRQLPLQSRVSASTGSPKPVTGPSASLALPVTAATPPVVDVLASTPVSVTVPASPSASASAGATEPTHVPVLESAVPATPPAPVSVIAPVIAAPVSVLVPVPVPVPASASAHAPEEERKMEAALVVPYLSTDPVLRKMQKNALKAQEKALSGPYGGFYASNEEISASLERGPKKPLKCTWGVSSKQGKRSEQQDSYTVKDYDDRFSFVNVVDGYGDSSTVGTEIGELYLSKFKALFSATFVAGHPIIDAEVPTKLCELFNRTIREVDQEYRKTHSEDSFDKEGGATCVVCVLDKKAGKLYTASVGDCFVEIFRPSISGIIAASRNFSWKSKKENERLSKWQDVSNMTDAQAMRSGAVVAKREFPGKYGPQLAALRPGIILAEGMGYYPTQGLNTPRAIGAASCRGTVTDPLTLSTPTMTVTDIEKNDVVIFASDGLSRYVTPSGRVHILGLKELLAQGLAERLAQTSDDKQRKEKEKFGDNVTVVTAFIE